MTDFNYLEKQKVTADKLSELTLYSIETPGAGESPTLIGRIGGEGNKPYFKASLMRSAKRGRQIAASKITEETIVENRAEDRRLYPKYVITGWRNVVDSKGEEVEFTKEACVDFFAALPNHIMDEVREHFGNPANFTGVTAEEAIAKGK